MRITLTGEIKKELNYINDKYRMEAGIKTTITLEYLEKTWTLKNELRRININY